MSTSSALLAPSRPFSAAAPSSIHAAPRAPGVRRKERTLVITLFFLVLILRLIYAFVMRPDSDESQHLHVVWAWTQGLLPYRDVFDNHPPLFHWLCAPLFAALGETPNILPLMRLAMLPSYALILWSVYRLSQQLYASARIGLWSVILTGLYPVFFFVSNQFRPDVLWAGLWMLALVTLTGGRSFTATRAVLGGLLLGTAIAISLKTALMLCALGVGSATALASHLIRAGKLDWKPLPFVGRVILLGAAMLLVPAAVAGYFIMKGAWAPFYYGIIQHNAMPGGLGRWSDPWSHGGALLPVCVLAYLGVAAYHRLTTSSPSFYHNPLRLRREIITLTALAYPIALYTLWPLISRQDLLPAIPLIMLVMVAALLGGRTSAAVTSANQPRHLCSRPAFLWFVTALEIAALFHQNPPWLDRTARERQLLNDVLRLTQPGEYVMDAKGETIYRPRAFFYTLEGVTGRRLRRGLIQDNIASRLIATGTALVSPSRLPPDAAQFVRSNYLAVGELRLLGKNLPSTPSAAAGLAESKKIVFEVEVPARYVIINSVGRVTGELDGTPLDRSRQLSVGRHEFIPSSATPDSTLLLFWAGGFEKGFSPFGGHR